MFNATDSSSTALTVFQAQQNNSGLPTPSPSANGTDPSHLLRGVLNAGGTAGVSIGGIAVLAIALALLYLFLKKCCGKDAAKAGVGGAVVLGAAHTLTQPLTNG